jgi:hypothetical protein
MKQTSIIDKSNFCQKQLSMKVKQFGIVTDQQGHW